MRRFEEVFCSLRVAFNNRLAAFCSGFDHSSVVFVRTLIVCLQLLCLGFNSCLVMCWFQSFVVVCVYVLYKGLFVVFVYAMYLHENYCSELFNSSGGQ